MHPVNQLSDRLTCLDLFCGAGGSTTGLVAAGIEVVEAANHWQTAIDTHAANHQSTHHYCVDLHQADPHCFQRPFMIWASPSCHTESAYEVTL